ncbi:MULTISPECIES: carbohydrate ABC transporter permease [Streptomyces]|uniref:Putative binding-protein dependent transport system integral membrane subunit n=1 Tax=Streptomyces scabiei (strain 87.22) TaxID=680198 RepID=C9YVW6_STRSW|nr:MULTISPECIES: carbohydrate ABC transporter permease [Streptomyces]MBP5860454.1 carbohydrate ABC transporter permease [Streptomyces sp. LBUM 1484]MBP5870576.1 carbohydrate ABC transporter permease [Streptomyces sp. LBUM 1485]MBP5927938.1 carbohydrate ABC transporter permease [Streptomyces sp. LBUM 1479]MBP5879178.1 carbohydrate ABC transporter permease [Streptomyces sp. LBUM 1477]MBP5886999.1 carbohydrate ABC transporter permease [Streptomyces sp. LBUM 1487]
MTAQSTPAPVSRGRAARTLTYLSLAGASVVVLLPLVAVLLTSLKTERQMAEDSGALTLPDSFLNLDNYATAFRDGEMLAAFGNTALILLVAVTGTVVIGSMAAYAIDRFTFRFRKLVVALFLVATLVPGVTTQVATFQIVDSFGMFDTLWAPIALYMGTDIVSIYIFLQFVRSIPVSLDEAARLDGANHFTIYRKIIFPLLKPAIATVVIVKGITVYNDFYIPFLYMPSDDLGVISTSLFRFKGPFGAHWETISAGAVLVILPTLLAFLLLQRFIYNGFMRGATK